MLIISSILLIALNIFIINLIHKSEKNTNPILVEYNKFLKGYLNKENKEELEFMHCYDRYTEGVYLVTEDGEHEPGYGARSYIYVVPKGIKYTFPNGYGHDTICFLEDFSLVGYSLMVYRDTYGHDYFFETIEKNNVVYNWTTMGHQRYLVLGYDKKKGIVRYKSEDGERTSNWSSLQCELLGNDKLYKDYAGHMPKVIARNRIIDDVLNN